MKLARHAATLATGALLAGVLSARAEGVPAETTGILPAARVLDCAAGELAFPEAAVADPSGAVFIVDKGHHRVVRTVPGQPGVSIVAGTGELGFSGDGGPATAARLALPEAIALDRRGNLYVADTFNSRIRKIDPEGRIVTFAGSADVGDGGPAEAAELSLLGSLTVHGDTLYIADTGHHRIRAVGLRRHDIHTVAGLENAGFSGDGGPASQAQLYRPEFVATDPKGNLYIADTFNNRIRRVDAATGRITSVAGNGEAGYNGDGIPAAGAALFSPEGMAFDRRGNLYIADMGNDRIRRVEVGTGIITTVAGTGEAGFNGDGRKGIETQLNYPISLEYDSKRQALLIADLFNHRIRRLDLRGGTVTTIAGMGAPGDEGDGGPATAARLYNPEGILLDLAGNLYIADHTNHRVRRVDVKSGRISTVAGSGLAGYSGDGGPALQARLFSPSRMAIWRSTLFVTDSASFVIRAVDLASGVIRSAVGGAAERGDGPAVEIRLAQPEGLALFEPYLYIADSGHHRVLRVSLETGWADMVLGTGRPGFTGDGGPARRAQVSLPKSAAVDGRGNLFVADLGNNRIRRLDRATGIVSTVLASGLDGLDSFDRGGKPEVAARSLLMDLEVTAAGELLIADVGNGRVRLFDPRTSRLHTVAGLASQVAGGEAPPLFPFGFHELKWVALDSAGDLLVTDTAQSQVLKLSLSHLKDSAQATAGGATEP
ncbi:MAG TPA: hypothetical protein VGS07_07010 [Thermoanaerobaculia bacterium]|nr:hypothetical protein [Thermoanaerobaculia bacterium]